MGAGGQKRGFHETKEVGAADEAKAGLVRWLCFVLSSPFLRV